MVEHNYNLIELGPKENGQVVRIPRNLALRQSPFRRPGRGDRLVRLEEPPRQARPGLARMHVVAFDEVAGNNFKSANDKDMYKGYIKQGSFSRGDDKGNHIGRSGDRLQRQYQGRHRGPATDQPPLCPAAGADPR